MTPGKIPLDTWIAEHFGLPSAPITFKAADVPPYQTGLLTALDLANQKGVEVTVGKKFFPMTCTATEIKITDAECRKALIEMSRKIYDMERTHWEEIMFRLMNPDVQWFAE
jgi:hypothetical protein